MKSPLSNLYILTCAIASVACGSSSDDDPVTPAGDPMGSGGGSTIVGDSGGVGGGTAAAGSGGSSFDDPDPMGGSMLPNDVLSGTNGTMPCDPLLDTGFDGDELCVLPADPGTGAYFHAGPIDYDDPDQIAEFVLEAGEETTEYYVVESSNDEVVWFRDQHYRMRPGSHHLIMYTLNSDPPRFGWVPSAELDRAGPIGGTQVYAMDFPEAGKVAPEDTNLVRPMSARQVLAFEMHYVNATSDPILREAWVNLMDNPIPAEEREILGAPFLVGAQFSVPPQTTQVVNYQHEIPAADAGGDIEMRIVSLFGHRHASSSRFSIWLNRGGSRDLVYEDYDWAEAKEFFYNSVIENPEPDPATLTAGAASGQQFLRTGDVLEWECEMTNTLDEPLTFGNGVYVKEMCNVFGTLTAESSAFLFGFPTPTVTTL